MILGIPLNDGSIVNFNHEVYAPLRDFKANTQSHTGPANYSAFLLHHHKHQ